MQRGVTTMAQDPDVEEFDDEEVPEKKRMKLPILIGIILGIIVVQAGIVMAAIKYFAPQPVAAAAPHVSGSHGKETEEESEEDESGAIVMKKVGTIITTKNDIYVNPRGSADEIAVVSLGMEIEPEGMREVIENKLMVPVQSLIITRFSQYSAEELQREDLRDSLRSMIKKDLKPYFRGLSEESKESVRLLNVYFPKFIIQ